MNTLPFEKVLSFGKYLFWCDLSRKNFLNITQKVKSQYNFKVLFALSQWYASFYVTIEGWKQLGLRDKRIDYLIEEYEPQVDKLRRFRNTIYHYQQELFDHRFLEGIRDNEIMFWISCLDCELKNFLWNYPKRLSKDTKKIQILQKEMFSVLNWKPKEIISSEIDRIKGVIRKAMHDVKSKNDFDSPESLKMISTICDTLVSIEEISDNPLFEELKKIGMNNDKMANNIVELTSSPGQD